MPSMVYGESDIGPFEMSLQERQSCQYDFYKATLVEKVRSVDFKKTQIIEIQMETEVDNALANKLYSTWSLPIHRVRPRLFQLLSLQLLPSKYVKNGLAKGRTYFKYYGKEVSSMK